MSSRPVTGGLKFKAGKGLVAASDDGDFEITMAPRIQLRYEAERVDADDEWEQSLQIRRARLKFGGHAWGPNNKFKLELAFSPRDTGTSDDGPTTSILLDYYWEFAHFKPATLRVGQYKVPFNRQRVISSGSLQLVDRSIVNSEFNLDRDIGFDLRTKGIGDVFRYYVGMFIGEGRNTFQSSDFGMMYLARVELLPLGIFDDYVEADFERTKPRLSIGLAYGVLDDAKYERGIKGSAFADGGNTDMQLLTADVMFKAYGFSLFSEGVIRDGSRNFGDAVDDMGVPIPRVESRDGFGAMVQAGYLVPRTRFEVAARYGAVRGDAQGSLGDENELGGGASYYFAKHQLKLQADYFKLWETTLDEADDRVRVQLQAAF